MAHIKLIRGDDYVLKVVVTDIDGIAIDIAGDTIYFTIKRNIADLDVDAVLQLVEIVPSGADATGGIHRMQLPNTIEIGSFHYDVQWKRDVSGTGNIVTLVIDRISITPDVTRLPQTTTII